MRTAHELIRIYGLSGFGAFAAAIEARDSKHEATWMEAQRRVCAVRDAAREETRDVAAERDALKATNANLERAIGVAVKLLNDADLDRYCGYDHTATTCPMTLPCWHHRRNVALAAVAALIPTGGPK